MLTIPATPLLQTLAGVGIFVAALLLAWLVPIFMHWLFSRVFRIEVYYAPPTEDGEHYEESMSDHNARIAYSRAPWWRTHLWSGLYVIFRIAIFLSGLVVAFWMIHEDLWYIVTGLGISLFIALFGLANIFRKFFYYLWLTFMGGPVRLGDRIWVAGKHGEIVDIGPLSITLHGRYNLEDVQPIVAALPPPVVLTHTLFAGSNQNGPMVSPPVRGTPGSSGPPGCVLTACTVFIPNTWVFDHAPIIIPAHVMHEHMDAHGGHDPSQTVADTRQSPAPHLTLNIPAARTKYM